MNDYSCEVCHEFYYDDRKQKWIMTVQNSNWDYHNDAFDYEEIEVNYCFECGIKLGGNK